MIGNINASIRELVTEMDRNEITLTNQKAILSNLTYINQNREKVNSLLQQLTPSQTDSLRVPWLDGRMLPIFMYDGSYRLVMTRINAEINQTLEKLLKEEQQRQEEEERKRREEQKRKQEEAIQRELAEEYNKLNTSITAETLESHIDLSIACKTDVIIDWGDNTKTKILYYNPRIEKRYDSNENHIITIKGEVVRLKCSFCKLISLDVSKNTALIELDCSRNQLTSLDVSKNKALTNLSCWNNQLTSLDVSKNTALTSLSCSDNQLTSLDVTKNTALTYLNCGNNELTSLDVTKNTALTELRCNNNLLTSLDISKNTALIELRCSENLLTSLDISKNTALTKLESHNEQVNSLKINTNKTLCIKSSLEYKDTIPSMLTFCNDKLTSLDVSNSVGLQNVISEKTNLISLNASNCIALESISFENNAQLHLDISNCPRIKTIKPGSKSTKHEYLQNEYQIVTKLIAYYTLDILSLTDNSLSVEAIQIESNPSLTRDEKPIQINITTNKFF